MKPILQQSMTAPPYGEYKLYAILTGYTCALLHLRVRRVGHDSAEIGYLLSTLFKP